MIDKLFVDTDVIIDFFTDRMPHANPATEIFELNVRKKVKLFLSATSLNNIYYIVRRYLGHSETLSVIKDLIELTEIIPTTKSEIVQALKTNFKDFEDSIQYASALTIKGINAILTRNLKDYSKSEIAIFTPENYLRTLE